MKTQTVYVPVDVKDRLPEIDSPEIFLLDDGNAVMDYVDRELGNIDGADYTHWLEKKDNMIVMSLEEAKLIFDAGCNYGMDVFSSIENGDDRDTNIPDKDEYFSNILNK